MTQVSKRTGLLKQAYRCHHCGKVLPVLPPCPSCGREFEFGMDLVQYNEIIKFLSTHKGSQVRLFLGKKDKKPILSYQLLTKKQLNEMSQ